MSEIGAEGLLAATAHVWNSLLPPQSVRAALIAKSAGITAQGKGALYLVLEAFLVTFEHDCDPPPLPERLSYASSEAWHAAVQEHFARGAATMDRVITTFAMILDSGQIGPAPLKGTSMTGP